MLLDVLNGTSPSANSARDTSVPNLNHSVLSTVGSVRGGSGYAVGRFRSNMSGWNFSWRISEQQLELPVISHMPRH